MSSLPELAADLEFRDAAVAAEIGRVRGLADGARTIAGRVEEIARLLEGAPAEHAGIDRSEAGAQAGLRVAETELSTADALVARLEAAGRTGQDLANARRDLAHVHEVARDADARVERLALRRADLAETERAAQAEIPVLVARAQAIAGRLVEVPRVSVSGRVPPEPTLPGLIDWAARVHVALLVVRGQLDVERDRLVREANEFGSVVLGEELAGSSVQLVGKRVRTVLAG